MNNPETLSLVYITAGDKAEAIRIGRALVEERLCACVNVFDGMTSVYHWQGEIEESNEAVLIAKTRSDLVEQLTARVKELHSYSCPCVIAWPLHAGNVDYVKWLHEETTHRDD